MSQPERLAHDLSSSEFQTLVNRSTDNHDGKCLETSRLKKTVHIINYLNLEKRVPMLATTHQWNKLELKRLENHL